MAIKTFTTGEVLTASDTNTYLANSGLVYVTSATVGTGVSSVTVTGAFNSTYDNYRIIYSGGVLSTGDTLSLKMGTTATSGHYGVYLYANYVTGTPLAATNNNNALWSWVGGAGPDNAVLMCDLYSPNLAKTTRINSGVIHYVSNFGTYTGVETSTTQHTSFQIIPASGTLTGGTITVYGYRKA